ncbi:uncharacterized protein PG986_011594 [Apiospora aurea]|uniref:Uncharacterized protein n=1 Tax=Apiospora aurea TaxID=335848 RepID=A0ABR1PXM3_9PEZI
MAGNDNIVLHNAKAYAQQAKESLAFSRFVLLAKMAQDASLCAQDIRFVLSKYHQWLEPAGRANLARFAGNHINYVSRNVGAIPTSLYEVKEGGRDYELRKAILQGAVDEVVRDPLALYGEKGWFLDFVCWLKWGEPLELAVLDPALYAVLMAQQLLANPGLVLPEPVMGRVKQAWWSTFNIRSKAQLEACTCGPVVDEERGRAVYPNHGEKMQTLTDLMDDVFARLSPPLDRQKLCDQPWEKKPKPVNDLGFNKRWTDLLHLLQALGVKNRIVAQEAA